DQDPPNKRPPNNDEPPTQSDEPTADPQANPIVKVEDRPIRQRRPRGNNFDDSPSSRGRDTRTNDFGYNNERFSRDRRDDAGDDYRRRGTQPYASGGGYRNYGGGDRDYNRDGNRDRDYNRDGNRDRDFNRDGNRDNRFRYNSDSQRDGRYYRGNRRGNGNRSRFGGGGRGRGDRDRGHNFENEEHQELPTETHNAETAEPVPEPNVSAENAPRGGWPDVTGTPNIIDDKPNEQFVVDKENAENDGQDDDDDNDLVDHNGDNANDENDSAWNNIR
ncbi:hypothetical protein, partial [Salmonella sp. s51228]|uniref:hypothetical protein n=1 Tax=Salmonella sp. s51228 TaxID=3159652 RepID=UPI00397F8977